MRAIRPADESLADESPADETAVQAIRPVDQDAIRLATILGVLSTAALLGVVSVTAGLGVAGWIAGLATGWAATALIVTARMRSDQPTILPADWVTLTRAVLCAGVHRPGRRLVARWACRCRAQRWLPFPPSR